MSRTGAASLIFAGTCVLVFCLAAIAALAIFLFPKNSVNSLLLRSSYSVSSPIDLYKSATNFPSVISGIKTNDGRGVIVDNFLRKNGSPMVGMGSTFVFVADKYGIDWKLLPAIAFQESNLGKKIPKGSYNAWGWAVYSGTLSGVRFDSWEHAIETVAKGIKERYISQGLTTPEAIMTRYTPGSDGSWAYAVRVAMDEMTQ